MSHLPENPRPHIAILTAGGAGMFCGSCMHDNTWARVLRTAGYEISLIPAYTPIRVDEQDLSSPQVFFGGINVYLNSRWPWWRHVPHGVQRWLNHPRFIQLMTRWGISTQATELGAITSAMLDGADGPHRAAVNELATYFQQLQPNVVLFTNALLSGALRTIRAHCPARMLCILQGDDIFLEALIEPFKTKILEQVRQKASQFDGFVVQSRYYRDFMTGYLQLPPDRFHQLPLTIDCTNHTGRPKPVLGNPPVIGYFARICEEKGLHRLVEACVLLRKRGVRFRLSAGGYLPEDRLTYLNAVRQMAAPLQGDFSYIGSPATHAEKVEFFKSLDIFSLPTVYHEPKGLSVLEACANGIPVVLPDHGAFPELIESTAGGILFPADDVSALSDALEKMLQESQLRRTCAEAGWHRVRCAHDFSALEAASAALFGSDASHSTRQPASAAS